MNIGTPDEPTVNSVKSYLKEFLLDPDVIDLPMPLRHLLVRGIILRTRPQKIAPKYKMIWMDEGSPLRVYTQKMANSLELNLKGIRCEVGMRYGNPSIRTGLEKLRDEGVDELLLAPLFPHFAQATTLSALKHAYKQLKIMKWEPKITELTHFPTSPSYIEPLVNSIRPHLKEDFHLLFSYHGLPISHVKRTDSSRKHCQKVNDCCMLDVNENSSCYARHCMLTTLSVVDKLGLNMSQWSLSYQSRLGPAKWLEPSTIKKVKDLAKKGYKNLVIVSPAFLVDGLETLEELDVEARKHFNDNGGKELTIVSCLNDNKEWIDGLSNLVYSAFKNLPLIN